VQDDPDRDGDLAAWWDETYESAGDPPWDTGEPQPAIVEAAETSGLRGRVLDVGCGTGAHALWAAERGHDAVGVDVSSAGVEQARATAADRDLDATFRVANALDLPDGLGPFDTVVDSGLFHAFGSSERETYATELAGVVRSGGRLLLVGFAEGAPEDWGPNPFAPEDVRAAFGRPWDVRAIRETGFETRETTVPGLLAILERS
jgi:SAM-dependent methyltransferase